jgi:NAD(P)-dependent dehydrogenase (short-subunit alcohol dehydrogenase family)
MNVIISGASKGIGRAMAELFASKGANLAICARSVEDIKAFGNELAEKYKNQQFIAVSADMSKKDSIANFAAEIRQHWSRVDLLINNAGVFIPCPLADPNTVDAFEQMMDTNLYSAYYLTLETLPLMLPNKSGHVFNICSIASIMPYGAYAVSKHAMLGFSRVLREEMKDKGIRVTAILPGATRTASWDGSPLPEERFMKAEDIAEAVWGCYNLSPQTVVEEMILRPQLGDI